MNEMAFFWEYVNRNPQLLGSGVVSAFHIGGDFMPRLIGLSQRPLVIDTYDSAKGFQMITKRYLFYAKKKYPRTPKFNCSVLKQLMSQYLHL